MYLTIIIQDTMEQKYDNKFWDSFAGKYDAFISKYANKTYAKSLNNGKVILPTYCHGQNYKTRFISAIMSITGFKAANKWSLKQFQKFIEREGLKIDKEEIIKDKIHLSFIVASKK
jgi:hypothetical protein